MGSDVTVACCFTSHCGGHSVYKQRGHTFFVVSNCGGHSHYIDNVSFCTVTRIVEGKVTRIVESKVTRILKGKVIRTVEGSVESTLVH